MEPAPEGNQWMPVHAMSLLRSVTQACLLALLALLAVPIHPAAL